MKKFLVAYLSLSEMKNKKRTVQDFWVVGFPALALILALILPFSLASCMASKDNKIIDQSGGERISERFLNIFSSGTYHMKSKMLAENGGAATNMETYSKDGMMTTMMGPDGDSGRMVFRDRKRYIVDDKSKTYKVSPYDKPPVESVETNGMTYTGRGTAEFAGKTMTYEEYTNAAGGKVRYFIDGNQLAGIRNMGSGYKIDIAVLILDPDVPDSIFEIPDDYQQIEENNTTGSISIL